PAGSDARGRIQRGIEAARAIVAENAMKPDTSRLPAEEFGTVEFVDGRILERSGGKETEIAAELSGRVNWPALNGRADVTASGLWRGEKAVLEASAANPLLLVGGGATAVRLKLDAAPASLSFDGTARLGENNYFEGRAGFS